MLSSLILQKHFVYRDQLIYRVRGAEAAMGMIVALHRSDTIPINDSLIV